MITRKEVVFCTTEEEVIFVKQRLGYLSEDNNLQFPYIFLDEDNAGMQTYVDKNNCIVYTFNEWLEKQSIPIVDYSYLTKILKKLNIK